MLGLRRHAVELVDPSPDWSVAFASEKRRIRGAVIGIDVVIEHIGSTAVTGLPAKPIIDIGILLRCEAHQDALAKALSSLGYIDRGDKGTEGGYLFVQECEPNVRTHHVHIIKQGDDAWNRYLRFRDTLRYDEQTKAQYAGLKRALAQRYSSDRAAYSKAKTEFIASVVAL